MVKRTQNLSTAFLIFGQVILVIAVLFLFYNQLNINYKFTFYEPANNPGQLTTRRIPDPTWWIQIVLTVTRVLLILGTQSRLSDPKDKWYPTFQVIAATFFIIAEIVAMIFYFITISGCNNSPTDSPSGINNICNDYRWCCVYGTIDPAPTPITPILEGCPLLLVDCVPAVPAGDLKWNFEFVIIFSFSFIMIVLGIWHIIFGILMGDGKIVDEENDEEEGEGDEFVLSNINRNNPQNYYANNNMNNDREKRREEWVNTNGMFNAPYYNNPYKMHCT